MWDEKGTLRKSFVGFCKSVHFMPRFRLSHTLGIFIYLDKSYAVGHASIINKTIYYTKEVLHIYKCFESVNFSTTKTACTRIYKKEFTLTINLNHSRAVRLVSEKVNINGEKEVSP